MSLIGIDVGTSGVKVILLDNNGDIAANIAIEYPVSRPKPTWSEQEPKDWWNATCEAIKKALNHSMWYITSSMRIS